MGVAAQCREYFEYGQKGQGRHDICTQKQPAPWRTAGRRCETGQRDNADLVVCGNYAVYAAVSGAGGRMRRYRNESEIGH